MAVEGFTANGIPLLGSAESSQRVQGITAPGSPPIVGGPENLMISSRALSSDLFIHRLWTVFPGVLKEGLGLTHHEFPDVRADEISIFGFEIDTADNGKGYRAEQERNAQGAKRRQLIGIDLEKEGSYVRDKTGRWYVHIPLLPFCSHEQGWDYGTIAKWREQEIGFWPTGPATSILFDIASASAPGGAPPKFYVAYVPAENWPSAKELEEKEADEEPEEGPPRAGEDWLPLAATKYVEFPIAWVGGGLDTTGLGGAGTGFAPVGSGNYRPRPGDLIGRSDPFYGLTEADWLEIDKERDAYISGPTTGTHGISRRQYELKLLQESTVFTEEHLELEAEGERDAKEAKEREELYEALTAFGKGGDFTYNDPLINRHAYEDEEKHYKRLAKIYAEAKEGIGRIENPIVDLGPMPYGARAAAMYGGVDQYSLLFPIADPSFTLPRAWPTLYGFERRLHEEPPEPPPVRLLDAGESMPTTGKLVWGFFWDKTGTAPTGSFGCELQRRGGFPGSFAASVGSAGLVPA